MAALPTDFSVTKPAGSPIANPVGPIDVPVKKLPESAVTIPAPSDISAEDTASVGIPSLVAGESFSSVGLPVSVSPVAVPDTDTPSAKAAVSVADIGAPTAGSPVAVPDIDTPSSSTPVSVSDIDTPSAKSAVTVSDIAAPSALTPNAATATTPPFPLNHARILYDNLLFDATVSSDLGGNPSYAGIPNTWQRWEFSGSGYIKFVLPANQDIDTICIGAHNLSSGGYTITPYYRAGLATSLVLFDSATATVTDNSIMFHVGTSVSARVIEIYTSIGTDDAYIGYISAGESLQMQRPFFGGHNPITDATVTKFYDSWTESGNIIGRSKRSQGQETSADWKYIDDTWYRTYFTPFKESALTLPFFFAWNLLEYPDDVGLCYVDKDITSPYQGIRSLRSISFTLKGAL